MKRWIRRLKCKWGFHRWTAWEQDYVKWVDYYYRTGIQLNFFKRHCTRCRKTQRV